MKQREAQKKEELLPMFGFLALKTPFKSFEQLDARNVKFCEISRNNFLFLRELAPFD
jgi:hypothetical protein